MATKIWAIFLVVSATLLTSLGQIFWKFGSEHLTLNLLSWFNLPIVSGFFFYGLAGLILIFALKHGELSTLYPIIATSYVWVALLSPFFFSDTFSLIKFVGIAVIILGIIFITRGERK